MENPNQGIHTTTLINGLLLGGGLSAITNSIKRIKEKRRLIGQLESLNASIQQELAKDDISLSGDFFKDKYSKYEKKANVGKGTPKPTDRPAGKTPPSGLNALPVVGSLPGLALLLSAAGIGYAGTNVLMEKFAPYQSADTPEFAKNYKRQRQKEFDRAVRLLRAVTDGPTWKDVETREKTAGLLKNAWPFSKTDDSVSKAVDTVGGDVHRAAGKLENAVDNYLVPILATVGIGIPGYFTYKALNKLYHEMRKEKFLQQADGHNATITAWLANRKDLGESGKELNTYIQNDDAKERKELNRILSAYESRYKK